jgi:hypothetical protein
MIKTSTLKSFYVPSSSQIIKRNVPFGRLSELKGENGKISTQFGRNETC